MQDEMRIKKLNTSLHQDKLKYNISFRQDIICLNSGHKLSSGGPHLAWFDWSLVDMAP